MSFCGQCGESAPAGAKFCRGCGAPLGGVESKSARPGSRSPSAPRSSTRSTSARAKPARTADAPCLIVVAEGTNRELLNKIRQLRPRDEVVRVPARGALRTIQKTLASRQRSGRRPSAVCLLGPVSSIPPVEVEDLTGMDESVLTDNPYGSSQPFDADNPATWLPEIPVGRIPTGDVELASRLLAVQDDLCGSWDDSLAVSASVWRGASEGVLETCLASDVLLETSPEVDHDILEERTGSPQGRLYFNVHGSDMEPDWYGEGDWEQPVVLTPTTLTYDDNAILVSEACYGATQLFEDESMSQVFLRNGGSCFIGSSIIAWGPPVAPIGQADIIAAESFRHLDAGATAAEALLRAKHAVLEYSTEEDEPTPPAVLNTVLSFTLLGPPWARVSSEGAPQGETVLGRARRQMNAAPGEDDSLLGQVRARIAERLPASLASALRRVPLDTSSLSDQFENTSEIEKVLGLEESTFQHAVSTTLDVQNKQLMFVAARHQHKNFSVFRGAVVEPSGRVAQVYHSK